MAAGLSLGLVSTVFAAEKMAPKAGDTVYACNCGEKCTCYTMSKEAGKCGCGKDMVQAKVEKVEGADVTLKADGWAKALTFKTAAK